MRTAQAQQQTAHTPGPWRAVMDGDCLMVYPVMSGLTQSICAVGEVGARATEADARLIAAAPDLLAALRAGMQKLTDMHAVIHDQEIEEHFVDEATNMISDGETAISVARAAIARAE